MLCDKKNSVPQRLRAFKRQPKKTSQQKFQPHCTAPLYRMNGPFTKDASFIPFATQRFVTNCLFLRNTNFVKKQSTGYTRNFISVVNALCEYFGLAQKDPFVLPESREIMS